MKFETTPELLGKRIDAAAATLLPDISRSKIQTFEMLLNGKSAKWSEKLKDGDTVEIIIPEKTESTTALKPEKAKLDILFEDEYIIIVNKPRGIAVHPGAGNQKHTLVQQLLGHTKLSSIGGDTRPGIVHRIDKDTSGILVAAKTDEAHTKLSDMFSKHDLTRKYTCFCWGIPSWESAEITGNIQRSKKNRQKMTMVKYGGKPAETIASVIDAWSRADISEIQCELKTGRTHQIRVHLSNHGFPLVGDKEYGRTTHRIQSIKPSELLSYLSNWKGGQMLHAGTLEFNHPITNAHLKFKAPLPNDMKELKDYLDEYQAIK